MVSDFIQNRVDTAHNLIDEGAYSDAVEILKNIKHRVHEEDPRAAIERFENEHDKKLEDLIRSITNNSDDPLRKQHNTIEQWKKYSCSYLNFYSDLIRSHDI